MSERFVQLTRYDTLYTDEHAPVLVAAAALLKDTAKDAIIAQLKFQNISNNTIKALSVSILPYDTTGKSLGEAINYQYLDLNEERDSTFGQKEPIYLPDNTTREIGITVNKVIFQDNSSWNASVQNAWSLLVKPNLLSEEFNGDEELVKQYLLEYGDDSVVFPMKSHDFWFCKCGAINNLEEGTCHTCKAERDLLFSFRIEDLEKKKEERLQKHEEEEATKKAQAAAKKERLIKRLKIIIPVVAVVFSGFAIYFGIIQPNIELREKYDRAVTRYKEKKYDQAVFLFEQTKDYKDTKELLAKAKKGAEEQELYDEVKHAYKMPLAEAIRKLESVSDLSDTDQRKLEEWRILAKCEGKYPGQYKQFTSSTKNKIDISNRYINMEFCVSEGVAYCVGNDSALGDINDSDLEGYDYLVTYDASQSEKLYFSSTKALLDLGYVQSYYEK